MQGTHDPNAKRIMADEGIMWDLTGNTSNFKETTLRTKTYTVEGKELPSGLTTIEREWVLDLAETHGLESAIVEEESSCIPDVPYMGVPVRFNHGTTTNNSTLWSDTQLQVNGINATVELNRSSRLLTLIMEGQRKDDVANSQVDVWIQTTVGKVRAALKAAGFTEGDLEIDCEVIMGAEREAQCDPTLMRSLITTDQEMMR
jgi:hypothetical protein